MLILGIKTSGHDTAAAIVKDGQIIAASAEERFDRIKHSRNFPINSINFCLEKARIKINDLDLIAIPFRYDQAFLKLIGKFTIQYFPKSINATKTLLPYLVSKKLNGERMIREKCKYKGKILYLDHHECHAASAFFSSPFSESAILTIDARGESASTKLYKVEGNNISEVSTLSEYPHSFGYLYTSITAYLGFERNSGEGKVMGLAPYGDWQAFRKYEGILKLQSNGKFELDLSFFSFHLGADLDVSKKFENIFGPRRHKSEQITQRHKNIAAFAQYLLEKGVLHLSNFALEKTKQKNLCLAGGVALNSVANGLIQSKIRPEGLFIQPASTDDGASLGAALLAYSKYSKNVIKINQKEIVYLGPSYSETKAIKAMEKHNLKYKKIGSLEKIVAKKLAYGKIVAWFQGRAEFGPRALGNRSILANPQIPQMKNILNSKVKFRESFRPFAPAVIDEEAKKYFKIETNSPYMLLTAKVKLKYQKLLPAITHIDGTARVQTVAPSQNQRFWKLLKEFGKLCGAPIILNTSLNVKGEPIVNTPEDAIKSFLETGIDVLVIGDLLVEK